ncbi:MAG: STAS/SEC14 domain-containing protein [Bacteroidetes bacterium]|nr:STAS/SEC14 domain-containing protein [Bacteroidota bacterium]
MTEKFFNKEEGILYFKVRGDVTFEKMIENVESLGNDSTLPKKLKILEDSRLTKDSNLKVEELPAIAEKLQEYLGDFHSIRHAVVHESAINTAIAMVFNKLFSYKNYEINVFSTIEGAKTWLG